MTHHATHVTNPTGRAWRPALQLGLVAALVVGLGAPLARAKKADDAIPLDEARLFFELNHTDADLGIHGLVDADEWSKLAIHDPDGKRMLRVKTKGRLTEQGLTELFFESAEPNFADLAPADFFERFPEGEYTIEGVTLDGEALRGSATVTHVLPAPPSNVTISGQPAAANCDVEDLPVVSDPVVIDWDPVTTSHPDVGKPGNVEVVQYQLVVEREEPTLLVMSVDLPPSVTELTIPAGFIALGEEFKFEILVREASGNQTAIESCFEVE